MRGLDPTLETGDMKSSIKLLVQVTSVVMSLRM